MPFPRRMGAEKGEKQDTHNSKTQSAGDYTKGEVRNRNDKWGLSHPQGMLTWGRTVSSRRRVKHYWLCGNKGSLESCRL